MYQKSGKVEKRRLLLKGESRELLVYIGVGVTTIGLQHVVARSDPRICSTGNETGSACRRTCGMLRGQILA